MYMFLDRSSSSPRPNNPILHPGQLCLN